MRDHNGTAPWRFPSETGRAMVCRSNTCLTLAIKVIDYRVVKLNDSLFLFCDMDAWGAFYKATGRAATVVLGASRLLTNAIFQPPLAENWRTVEANRLSGSVSCASGTRRSPASDSSFERVSGSMQIYI